VADDQAVTPMEPPSYDASAIRRIRPPEVEGENAQWRSQWQLTTSRRVTDADLRIAEADASAPPAIDVRLTLIADRKVRLETMTRVHPLEVEAWPVIDSMLLTLDRHLGLAEINDCPRDWWRPFR
jgi:hypothetical protein